MLFEVRYGICEAVVVWVENRGLAWLHISPDGATYITTQQIIQKSPKRALQNPKNIGFGMSSASLCGIIKDLNGADFWHMPRLATKNTWSEMRAI